MGTTLSAWTFSLGATPPPTSYPSHHPGPSQCCPPEAVRRDEWVLIQVAFADLNVGAILHMVLIPAFPRSKACGLLEIDRSGIVQDTRVRKGNKAMVMLPASHALPTGTGTLAEYIATSARFALLAESGAKPGDRILVNAASGGIGHHGRADSPLDCSVPRALVVGISRGRNARMVERLGADQVINYTQHQQDDEHIELSAHLASRFRSVPFDAVIDTLGHQSLHVHSPIYLRAPASSAPSGR
ncbi:hypothetical protein BBK36DRAFT_1156010 [Trichoderma citrinoviride]|uniref:NAD(P)-binding protein n=1 Tax=Trichoderma citrinoviride TaxID=58853 RepID=A0A2T4BJE3_9HYPO|nr:hypothetical protein BBK36DRAFT_1156010 [Trichoderma citrinoviride]PTB69436.1 hypothetical protein BBK36DRAFT_1156010 [Trichoderma citrinoviride]